MEGTLDTRKTRPHPEGDGIGDHVTVHTGGPDGAPAGAGKDGGQKT
jgi:hypothetical protein